MNASRMHAVVTPLAVAYAVVAFLVPLEVVEVLGVPLVVAGAYVAGMRGGVTAGLWAIIVTGAAFLLGGGEYVASYVVTAVGYLVIGVLVGLAVDNFTGQRAKLQRAVEAAELARRQLEVSQRRYRLLFEQSADPVYLHGLDHDGEPTRFISVNDATCELLGYTREELLGMTPRAIDASSKPGQLRRMMRVLLQEGMVRYEGVRRTRNGELVPVEISSSLADVQGEPIVLSISRDIRERQREVRRLQELTLRDELTGLFNRRGLDVMLPEQAKRAKRSGHPVIVMYGDIDGFKDLNDTYGHDKGDAVLVAVAQALRATFRETDLVARLGGDEFCVVAEDIDAARLTGRLEGAMASVSRELGLPVAMSHGEVLSDWQGLEEAATLLARADARMYQAKQARRGRR